MSRCPRCWTRPRTPSSSYCATCLSLRWYLSRQPTPPPIRWKTPVLVGQRVIVHALRKMAVRFTLDQFLEWASRPELGFPVTRLVLPGTKGVRYVADRATLRAWIKTAPRMQRPKATLAEARAVRLHERHRYNPSRWVKSAGTKRRMTLPELNLRRVARHVQCPF